MLIRIGQVENENNPSTFLFAEIGNNHNKNITLVKQLIDLAVESGDKCAKFRLSDFAHFLRYSIMLL